MRFLQRRPIFGSIDIGRTVANGEPSVFMRYTVNKDNADAVVGATSNSASMRKQYVKEYIAENVPYANEDTINIRQEGNKYIIDIPIASLTQNEIDEVDEQMARHFAIEESGIKRY